jgi:hypothetical protein
MMNRPMLMLAALALLPVPAHADGPVKQTMAEAQAAKAADRAEILAMAGDYKVRFDMQETTPWAADYVPLERKISGGNEVVRVIEDTPDHIALQHLLVVEHGGKTHVIKHWRQDWDYQPSRVLVYAGPGRWVCRARADARRTLVADRLSGRRQPALCRMGPVRDASRRPALAVELDLAPLARRDAVRHPVYDRYYAINRHQPTPTGWIHWQDNTKMGLKDGKLVPIVQESVLNSYERFDGYDVKAADTYWAKTSAYWAAVRAAWQRVADTKGGIAIQEEPGNRHRNQRPPADDRRRDPGGQDDQRRRNGRSHRADRRAYEADR